MLNISFERNMIFQYGLLVVAQSASHNKIYRGPRKLMLKSVQGILILQNKWKINCFTSAKNRVLKFKTKVTQFHFIRLTPVMTTLEN